MFDFLDDEETYSYINIDLDEDAIIYIDTNIFMNDKAEYFFQSLTQKNTVVVPKEQYNELYKLKSKESKKAHKARKAFRNIEKLYDKNIIKIEELNDLKISESYADPVFIRLILENLKNNKKVIFITEDRDLRIRLKLECDKFPTYKNLLNIYELNDIEEKTSTRSTETPTWKKTAKVAAGIVALGFAVSEIFE